MSVERNSAKMFLAPEERNVYRTESRLEMFLAPEERKVAPFFRS